ncbi:glycosyltransferase family 2 protein [Marinimicrobium sp. C2-29]|uniref:glycosyltransferase family 2 protein n=1 Tax=Marinimicrobium sp. C2-29 TaxID=3139825 RepID=UPI003139733A
MASLIETNPLVSVIMPTYNNAELIGETIDSVRAQTYQNLEIIVVDDGSTDNTEEVIKELMQTDTRVHYKKIANSYSPTARNIGFKMAHGDYVASIDSDDLWPATKIEMQLEALNNNPDAVVVGCVQRFTEDSEGNKEFGTISCPPSQAGDYVHNLLSMDHQQMVNLNTLFAKRSTICADGLWDPEVWTAHDWEVWIRLAKKYPFIHTNEVLQHYRKHHSSVTGQHKWKTALKYQLLVVDRHSPNGVKNLWKKLSYRRLRYHSYISILLYDNRVGAATKLWFRSTFRSNMLVSLSGTKLLVEIAAKAVRRQVEPENAKNV